MDYNSMDYPAQRDFVKEFAVACRKAGLGLFIYYSVGIDWHHPYFLPNTMYDPARPHYKAWIGMFNSAGFSLLLSQEKSAASCTFLGWAYHTSSRQRQKSAEEVMELLRYCADMNANLLLNIGPRPDGTILEENIQTLEKVGRQLQNRMLPASNQFYPPTGSTCRFHFGNFSGSSS